MSCRLDNVIMITKFFIIHFFFSYFGLIVVIIMSLLNFRSYSSTHHTCHHTSSSVNFFFLFSSLLLQCVVTQHSWRCEIVMVACVDSLACVRHETSYQKILTDFCDTRTHFAALARACFHDSHVWAKSLV
jgi:hypothetical protein